MNQPIIILGAARSGTKMLRDTLAAASDLRVVEYDVNYIWRYGNEHYPHDQLPPELATERVSRFIRRQLPRIATGRDRSTSAVRFVEKTVGNVLRLPLVHRIYPRAKYVFLLRDGRDVAESAARCWRTPPKMGYLLRKLRTFPWLACGHYALSYGQRVLKQKLGRTPHLCSWGPRYPGIDEDVALLPLSEVCARQWVACIEAYEHARHLLEPEQITEVRYEDIVRQPENCLRTLCQRLELHDQDAVLAFARAKILPANVGKQTNLPEDVWHNINRIQGGVLARWGYTSPPAARHAALC